jgi:LAS superfamily LD-carboxypeptidase LdcB
MIVECEMFEKVHKKLTDYGFILRYPDGKDSIT